MSHCKSDPACKRVAVQKWHLVKKWPFVQKCPRAKVSPRAKVTLVQKCRSCKSDPFPYKTEVHKKVFYEKNSLISTIELCSFFIALVYFVKTCFYCVVTMKYIKQIKKFFFKLCFFTAKNNFIQKQTIKTV